VLTPPRLEGTVEVAPGRRLGFSEFGRPHGRAVIWLHGTPGARRQIPEGARAAAEELDICLVGIDRPGVGKSTPHTYDEIGSFADDLAVLLDALGIDRFAILGLSGGGPYTLAAAARLGGRVVTAGVMGGVAPTVRPDGTGGGIVDLARRFQMPLTRVRDPLGWLLTSFVWTVRPAAHPALRVYARLSPPGDRVVFARPEMRAMFIDDILRGSAHGMRAPVYDVVLFGRYWGFDLADVTVPVHWWHGDADHIVPLAHGQHCVELIPDAELFVRPGESHLGGFGAATEVLETILAAWDNKSVKETAV